MSSEVEKAQKAQWSKDEVTIFDKIISKEIPADIIYEDNDCMAFNDVNPQAPTHFLVIPKRRIPLLDEAKESDKDVNRFRINCTDILKNEILDFRFSYANC